MNTATVYVCEPEPGRLGRDMVALENVWTALTARGGSERRQVVLPKNGVRTIAGLSHVKPVEHIVALGLAAHAVLAEFEKTTLIAGGLDLDSDPSLPQEQLAQLIWSSVNTAKVVALGAIAWKSIQLLPLRERCFYQMPPLCLPNSQAQEDESILVIDHDENSSKARDLLEVLRAHYGQVDYARSHKGCAHDAGLSGVWADRSRIHIHVGHHTLATEFLRLVDTWQSRRVALQLLPRTGPTSGTDSDDRLLIENEANGFICRSVEQVLTCCNEILADDVLQAKFIAAGLRTVAPLARKWTAIADDLVS